jgi:glyoxylase-like metal-dependent hydrolase (beta-lactamase superfamily II)
VSQRVALAGGDVHWLVFAPAHLAGNAALWHRESATLLAGAFVTNAVVPDATEADIDGWLAALDAMERLSPRYVVPDRGAPGNASLIAMTRSYLLTLRVGVAKAFAEGVDLAEVAAVVDAAAFKTWDEFEARHDKNVRAEMLRREAAALQPR